MPIATSVLAAVLLTSPTLPSALPAPPMSLTVVVDVAEDVPPALAAYMLAETAEIWHAAGFTLIWHRAVTKNRADVRIGPSLDGRDGDPAVPPYVVPFGRPLLPGLRVVVGNDRGRAETDPHVLPLGWITFEADSPLQQVYVSFANALQLLSVSDLVVGRVATMTIKERQILLGRAMGRALAHEIGHYLLASKGHTAGGIMQARRGAAELFSSSRRGFQLEGNQRRMIAERLQALAAMASVAPPAE